MPRPLGQRLADEPEPVLLEVAQAAVDQPRRPRRRPDRDVVALDQRRPAGRASPRRARRPSRRSRRRRPARRAACRRGPRDLDRGPRAAPRSSVEAIRRGRPPGSPVGTLRPAGPADPPQDARRCRRAGPRSGAASAGPRRGRRPAGGTSRRPARRTTTTTSSPTRSASRRPGERRTGAVASGSPAQPRSASCGMPIGATSTLPASALPLRVARPVFGRWKVIVRSARTAGIGRVAARQVDGGRRVDGEDRDHARRGPG